MSRSKKKRQREERHLRRSVYDRRVRSAWLRNPPCACDPDAGEHGDDCALSEPEVSF